MATKEKEPTNPVYFEWTQVNTDPTPYKVLSPTLHPVNMQVMVEVPVRFFIDYNLESQTGILSADGLAYACRQLAASITRVYVTEK